MLAGRQGGSSLSYLLKKTQAQVVLHGTFGTAGKHPETDVAC